MEREEKIRLGDGWEHPPESGGLPRRFTSDPDARLQSETPGLRFKSPTRLRGIASSLNFLLLYFFFKLFYFVLSEAAPIGMGQGSRGLGVDVLILKSCLV